jgi:hypothetical protein
MDSPWTMKWRVLDKQHCSSMELYVRLRIVKWESYQTPYLTSTKVQRRANPTVTRDPMVAFFFPETRQFCYLCFLQGLLLDKAP